MTKTVEEVRRELFEAHIKTANPDDYAQDGDRLFQWNGASYAWTWVNWDWLLWNAALDAVEIQLPKACAYESLDRACVFVQLAYEISSDTADPVELARLDDCRAAIEQTGLGLKVKP